MEPSRARGLSHLRCALSGVPEVGASGHLYLASGEAKVKVTIAGWANQRLTTHQRLGAGAE
jgi:hypothetical protein